MACTSTECSLCMLFVLVLDSADTCISFGNKCKGPMQADFDVRWCKGPIVERLFQPLIAKIEGMGGQILGGCRVQQVHTQGRLTGAR